MITRALFLGSMLAAATCAEEIPRAVQIVEPPKSLINEDLDRVISSTKQFRITGGTPRERAIIAQLAEESKDELLGLTEERDTWKVPVSIPLHGKPGDPMPLRTAALQILFSEVGYDIRLDVHLSRGIERDRFKFATTAALIYERALRTHPATESGTPFFVPPWLVDGLREAAAWQRNLSDRRLYEALFKTGGLFKTDELFAVDDALFEDMDAAMRAAFRVSSGALVMALLQQPQGKEGFRSFLTQVADYQGEMPALLRRHFPELNLSETSLSKWWALQLANIGARNLATDILTIAQTETALVEELRLHFRTPEGIIQQKEISTWPEIAALSEPERINAVRPAQEALVRLSYRCFPSFRPILSEYQLALGNLAKNKTETLSTQFAALAERRLTMTAKAIQARDYLDYFEITRAGEISGAFDDYMRLKDRLKSKPHRRTDDLSIYLDRMDAIFTRKGSPDASASYASPENSLIPDLPQP